MALTEGQRLKEGRIYFKATGIIHMAFQNLVILSFQITIHHTKLKTIRYFQFSIGDALRDLVQFVQR